MDLNYLKPLLEKKAQELGYELVELTSRKEKGDLILSIVVDRVEPIDMNAISEFSSTMSNYLDEIDQSDERYFLDISSLGAEKPLKVEALANYIDRYVEVRLINPIQGENIYLGFIRKVEEEFINLEIRIKSRIKEINIAKSNISKIRLAIKF